MKKRFHIMILGILFCIFGFVAIWTQFLQNPKVKIAFVYDKVEDETLLSQVKTQFKLLSKEYPISAEYFESSDLAHWEYHIREISKKNFDLVIGMGTQSATFFGKVAIENILTRYAVLDAVSNSNLVTSLSFTEVEGAYLLGVMMAKAFPNENKFGVVSSSQTQTTYKYRYGFLEGLKSVNAEAELLEIFIESTQDQKKAYEATMKLAKQDVCFVMGLVSSLGNEGIYQAVLELNASGTPIYTSGLILDQTTQENPYILGGLLKNIEGCLEDLVENLLSDNLTGGVDLITISEGVFDVVHLTEEPAHFLNETIITPEILAYCMEIKEQIIQTMITIIAPEEVI